MPRAKKEPNRCKHHVMPADHRCKLTAIDNDGYCHLHKSAHRHRAPDRHAILSRYLTAEEMEAVPGLEKHLGDIDRHIIGTELMLGRVLTQMRAIEDGESDGMVELETLKTSAFGKNSSTTTRRRAPLLDYYDRLQGRLQKWHALKIVMAEAGQGTVDPREKALEIRDILAQMESASGGDLPSENGNGKL